MLGTAVAGNSNKALLEKRKGAVKRVRHNLAHVAEILSNKAFNTARQRRAHSNKLVRDGRAITVLCTVSKHKRLRKAHFDREQDLLELFAKTLRKEGIRLVEDHVADLREGQEAALAVLDDLARRADHNVDLLGELCRVDILLKQG